MLTQMRQVLSANSKVVLLVRMKLLPGGHPIKGLGFFRRTREGGASMLSGPVVPMRTPRKNKIASNLTQFDFLIPKFWM